MLLDQILARVFQGVRLHDTQWYSITGLWAVTQPADHSPNRGWNVMCPWSDSELSFSIARCSAMRLAHLQERALTFVAPVKLVKLWGAKGPGVRCKQPLVLWIATACVWAVPPKNPRTAYCDTARLRETSRSAFFDHNFALFCLSRGREAVCLKIWSKLLNRNSHRLDYRNPWFICPLEEEFSSQKVWPVIILNALLILYPSNQTPKVAWEALVSHLCSKLSLLSKVLVAWRISLARSCHGIEEADWAKRRTPCCNTHWGGVAVVTSFRWEPLCRPVEVIRNKGNGNGNGSSWPCRWMPIATLFQRTPSWGICSCAKCCTTRCPDRWCLSHQVLRFTWRWEQLLGNGTCILWRGMPLKNSCSPYFQVYCLGSSILLSCILFWILWRWIDRMEFAILNSLILSSTILGLPELKIVRCIGMLNVTCARSVRCVGLVTNALTAQTSISVQGGGDPTTSWQADTLQMG